MQFPVLNSFPELIHFSTVRSGISNTGYYNSLNPGLNFRDVPENIMTNKSLLSRSLGIDPDRLIFPKQTHSATVKTITSDFFKAGEDEQKNFLKETDAVMTSLAGVCIAVKTADCVPVLLYDPQRKVIAAIHAGWRGTVQNIVVETISRMTAIFGSQPSDLFAAIGPSIGPGIYEVGREVWDLFPSEFYRTGHPSRPDKRLLDLWKANHHQLMGTGIPSFQIEIARICTFSDPVRFYSARRDGAQTGRMGTGIMMK